MLDLNLEWEKVNKKEKQKKKKKSSEKWKAKQFAQFSILIWFFVYLMILLALIEGGSEWIALKSNWKDMQENVVELFK